jgi:hypothetical protein
MFDMASLGAILVGIVEKVVLLQSLVEYNILACENPFVCADPWQLRPQSDGSQNFEPIVAGVSDSF